MIFFVKCRSFFLLKRRLRRTSRASSKIKERFRIRKRFEYDETLRRCRLSDLFLLAQRIIRIIERVALRRTSLFSVVLASLRLNLDVVLIVERREINRFFRKLCLESIFIFFEILFDFFLTSRLIFIVFIFFIFFVIFAILVLFLAA